MEIRGFTEEDRAELRDLAVRAGEGSPSGALWGHPESEMAVYLEPYMDLEPKSLFLAVDDGRLVGYLAGCLDSAAFPSEEDRLTQAIIKYRLIFRREPAAFFARSVADMASAKLRRQPTAGELVDPQWPAHLHINVAPEARGRGAADGLMDSWFERLTATSSPGCYLQTLLENARAIRFFERMGFINHGPAPLVPGVRYQGHHVHQQTMVHTF